MPSVSKAQAIAMRMAAAGKSNLGIPKSVGQEFTADQGSIKKLPPRAHALRQRGMISKAPTVARRPKRHGLFDAVDGKSSGLDTPIKASSR
jgi:hypothetical protein